MTLVSDVAIRRTLRWEGGYVNHPADRGGATNHGITERFARTKGYRGPMRELPESLAVEWYRESLWDRYRFEEVATHNPEVAGYLFDMSVNHGRWTLVAQRAAARIYQVVIDGAWGPKTHAAFVASAKSHPGRFLAELRLARCRYGVSLVKRDRSQEVFLLGWMDRFLNW